MTNRHSDGNGSTLSAAVEALSRGYQPVPIYDHSKKPYGAGWQHTRLHDEAEVLDLFKRASDAGANGIGLILGKPSGGLVDVDLDHPKALRLRDYFLPPSPMSTGRVGNPRSHRWYLVETDVPSTRQYKMPDKAMCVELRSTGAQTVIPPSIWWPKEGDGPSEMYRWEGEPWGGRSGPAVAEGSKLARQVALLAMGAVLTENWPQRGSRHEAYLALAGGLLRFGNGVHPFWERNLPVLIEALADVTHDDDGGPARVSEVMASTVSRLREGGMAVGFPKLAELIGVEHVTEVRRLALDIEALAGFVGTPIRRLEPDVGEAEDEDEDDLTLPIKVARNPMEERGDVTWSTVDLEPYLAGIVTMPEPSVLVRSDGLGLMYPGRVNSLYGLSESAKSWIALWACVQEMSVGARVVYIDLEDGPEGTLGRLKLLGTGAEDLLRQFRYVHPEGPHAAMERSRYGISETSGGRKNAAAFDSMIEAFDPTLIVADGMTVLYGLHGHDTNDASGTEIITGWLKRLCRSGRTTVLVIDHTGKGGDKGVSPIGSHHKVAMVQGSALQVNVIERPLPGSLGTVELVVHKDRPGSVRRISSNDKHQVAGIVTIDSREEGITRITIDPPDPMSVTVGDSANQENRLASLAQKAEHAAVVLALFGGDLDLEISTATAQERTGLAKQQVYDAWAVLVADGTLDHLGGDSKRWSRYRLRPPEV